MFSPKTTFRPWKFALVISIVLTAIGGLFTLSPSLREYLGFSAGNPAAAQPVSLASASQNRPTHVALQLNLAKQQLLHAESFFSSLKKERVKKRIYKTRALARADVFEYIEMFYNRTRRHSHLGGISPEAFERASS